MLSRLSIFDRALWLGLSILWVACLGLHLQRLLDEVPPAWVPVYVEPDPAAGPVVTGLWPEAEGNSLLVPGDRILSVGARSVRGAGRLEWVEAVYEAADRSLRVPARVQRGANVLDLEMELLQAGYPLGTLPLGIGFGLCSLLVLLRGRGQRVARAFSLGSMFYALQWCFFFGGSDMATRAGFGVFLISAALYPPFTLRAALMFPEDAAVKARWPYAAVWIFALIPILQSSWLFGAPLTGSLGLSLLTTAYALWIGLCLAVLAGNYRVSSPASRRQLQWLMLGFFVGLTPPALTGVLTATSPGMRPVYEASLLATVAMPTCVAIALLRSHLYDINRLLPSAVTYLLAVFSFFGALALVLPRIDPGLQMMGVTARFGVSGLLAAILLALAIWVHPKAMRIFAPESHQLGDTAARTRLTLASAASPEDVLGGLTDALSVCLQLESYALYTHRDGAYAPVRTGGSAVDFDFEADGALVRRLSEEARPVRVDPGSEPVSDAREGEVLRILRADVVMPVLREGKLDAFLTLGEKRSGDVFPDRDLQLLEALAERAGLELGRFDEADLRRGRHALGSAPGARPSCFLSYASHDEEFAGRLYSDLRQRGINCWFAPESLRTGEPFRSRIDEGLGEVEQLLVVISDASIRSRWVGYEVRAALTPNQAGGLRLFPIRIDDALVGIQDGWAAELRDQVHVGDFRRWQDESRYNHALERLVEDLGVALAKATPSTTPDGGTEV